MVEQKLCWKCKRKFMGKGIVMRDIGSSMGTGNVYYLTMEDMHCHHDLPEEKPACWCRGLDRHKYEVLTDRHQIPVRVDFCPQCGRRL
jgi:hypothetical protein